MSYTIEDLCKMKSEFDAIEKEHSYLFVGIPNPTRYKFMDNKFNVLDPVLVYATIDSINVKDGQLVYSLKLPMVGDNYTFVDFIEEENIQTVF